MIAILTPQQMKQADAHAIDRLHIPSLLLMENAGKAAASVVEQRLKSGRGASIIVLCGKGNNGGDGFVAARYLRERKRNVTVVLMDEESALAGDAQKNFLRLENIPVISYHDLQRSDAKPAVIVDAMLGTSFRGELRGSYREAVEWCNAQPGWKAAIDIPTGLNGETGDVLTAAFRADITVTLSNPKTGFYRGRAKEYTGEVIIAGIGIPGESIERYSGNLFLTGAADIREIFPKRRVDSHKHSVGKLFILAGSRGMTGAALLASHGAMRSGAGQVILGIPDSEYPIVAKRTLEVMPFGLPSTPDGAIARSAAGAIAQKIAWAHVVAVGCGLSMNSETQETVRSVIRETAKPMVIDADGLNALAGELSPLDARKNHPTILTPHTGEFSRLTGMDSSDIERDRFAAATAFAQRYEVVLVLKGAPTVIAVPSGEVFVNPTGNPGMSTAGSGDVLTGMIAAMAGQGLSAESAAAAGTYLHGYAGDIAAQSKGMYSMIASDIIKNIPKAIRTVVL